MALSQSALSALLDAFRTGDGVDMIRESVRPVLQELDLSRVLHKALCSGKLWNTLMGSNSKELKYDW